MGIQRVRKWSFSNRFRRGHTSLLNKLKRCSVTLGIPLLLFLALLSLPAKAQTTQGKLPPPSRLSPAIFLGGEVGATASFIYFTPAVNQTIHLGATAGIAMQVENSKYTALHLGLLYTLRGWSEVRPIPNETETPPKFTRYIHYLELPLLTHLYYPFGALRIGVEFGPQIGVMLAHNDLTKGANGFTELDKERYNYPLIGKFSWGLAAGPSISYDFGRHRIALSARFFAGFNSLISTKISDRYSTANELMGVVSLSYLFRLR